MVSVSLRSFWWETNSPGKDEWSGASFSWSSCLAYLVPALHSEICLWTINTSWVYLRYAGLFTMSTLFRELTAPWLLENVSSICDVSAAESFDPQPTGSCSSFIRLSFALWAKATVSMSSLLLSPVNSEVLRCVCVGGTEGFLWKGVTKRWWCLSSFSSTCGLAELCWTKGLCFLKGGTKAEGVLILSLTIVFLRFSVFVLVRKGGTNAGFPECADGFSSGVERCVGVVLCNLVSTYMFPSLQQKTICHKELKTSVSCLKTRPGNDRKLTRVASWCLAGERRCT